MAAAVRPYNQGVITMLAQEIIDSWNQNHPPGTKVKLTNGLGVEILTTTKSAAMLFARQDAVVYTRCMVGFIALNRLTVLQNDQ